MKRIILANDHAGTLLKNEAEHLLANRGLAVKNMGVNNDESIDYPDIFLKASEELVRDKDAIGIFICGTGIGACVTTNKVKSLHCALVHNGFTARMAKEHNHCRVIALGARIVNKEILAEILEAYLDASEMGGRHTRRVEKIYKFEQNRDN
ncbi:ribose 5-phosphate isomerase B [Spirochaetota bacterium]|nr:ribose 5-phosphate isomerase B [Spirochaetota bacterium]